MWTEGVRAAMLKKIKYGDKTWDCYLWFVKTPSGGTTKRIYCRRSPIPMSEVVRIADLAVSAYSERLSRMLGCPVRELPLCVSRAVARFGRDAFERMYHALAVQAALNEIRGRTEGWDKDQVKAVWAVFKRRLARRYGII